MVVIGPEPVASAKGAAAVEVVDARQDLNLIGRRAAFRRRRRMDALRRALLVALVMVVGLWLVAAAVLGLLSHSA
ncbi:MAG: hypothetical protein E6J14_01475 [Chloroflexi bacterium]|nr:MAG: hypothetical protein E6J14_01475 [Chloroflexota bacterium]